SARRRPAHPEHRFLQFAIGPRLPLSRPRPSAANDAAYIGSGSGAGPGRGSTGGVGPGIGGSGGGVGTGGSGEGKGSVTRSIGLLTTRGETLSTRHERGRRYRRKYE